MTGWVAFLLPLMPLAAQETNEEIARFLATVTGENKESASEVYDPLIPQLFAFDKKNDIFAGINNVDNKIVIVRRDRDNNPYIDSDYLVDKVVGRHDVKFIYRPKTVAIYENHVVFLASHIDSCYLAVLDLEGNLVKRLVFSGHASAFSHNPTENELYISGENATGYDVIVLDTSMGINHIGTKDATILHYQKPRMSEEIAVRDPSGAGMAIVAMSVVFLALLLLYLVFKQLGLQLTAMQERRSLKPKVVKVETKRETIINSGDVYAAIAAAIHLYTAELHDVENTVLTINKVSRTYSPWSSKIHGLNTYFKR